MSADAVFAGTRAALWLGLLWFSAPLLSRSPSVPSRLRDGIILGVAIPGVLAFAHVLNGTTCFGAALLVAAARAVQLRRGLEAPAAPAPGLAVALPALATLAVAWPALVRPLLQGDSLFYHLPNAAAWAQSGSLWTATTFWWWYPGGSELFAAGLLAAAGPLTLGFAGTAAALLLAERLSLWGVDGGLPGWVAGALAAATVSSFAFALQAANLANDLWLAAFVLEILWAARKEQSALVRSAALCALLKPYGFVYALLALGATRTRLRVCLAAFVPLALWIVRDLILWRGAAVPAGLQQEGNFPYGFATSLASHGVAGAIALVTALWDDGVWALVLFLSALASLAYGTERSLRIVALGALAFGIFQPQGFTHVYDSTGTDNTTRYFLTFLTLGACALVPLARRASSLAGIAGLAFTLYGIACVAAIFWNDATTHGLWLVLVCAGAVAFLPRLPGRGRAAVVLAMALVAYAATLAGSHPLDYYDDWLGAGKPTRFFEWLAQRKPPALVAWRLHAGAIAAVSPATRTLDAIEAAPCAEAQREHALLALANQDPSGDAAWSERRRQALACGPAIYQDGVVLVVAPATQ